MKQIQSFSLGILAAIGALFLEVIASGLFQPISVAENELPIKEFFSFGYIFFLAILIEEFLKFIAIYKAVPKGKNLILNSLFFGIGFSALEATLVLWTNGSQNADIFGITGIFLVHTSTSLLFGYSMRNMKESIFGYLPVFIIGMVIHSSYNIVNISEIGYQKQILFYILSFLTMLIIYLLIKFGFEKFSNNKVS